MRVFISHSSKDKPAVEALALALRERGIETWLDKWMIGPGDDIVDKINAGLEEVQAGLIVCSAGAAVVETPARLPEARSIEENAFQRRCRRRLKPTAQGIETG